MGRGPFQQGKVHNAEGDNRYNRTRSQHLLTQLDVEYSRSPLKNARDALRRANTRHSPSPPSKVGQESVGFSGEEDGDEENRMEGSKPFGGNSQNEHPFSEGTEENQVSRSHPSETSRGPLAHKMLKRSRSPSSERAHHAALEASTSAVPIDTHEASAVEHVSKHSADAPVVDSGESSVSNSKRPKLMEGKEIRQKTLESFFKPPSASRSKKSDKDVAGSDSASSASQNTPRPTSKLSTETSTIDAHATPSLAQLRAMPSLDLRTMTPSPRKPSLQLHRTPSTKKLQDRVLSEGSSLKNTVQMSEPTEDSQISSTSHLDSVQMGSARPESVPEASSGASAIVDPSPYDNKEKLEPPKVERTPSSKQIPRLPTTLRKSFTDSLRPPVTPRHQILSSKPFLTLSPLTPLPPEYEYDYEEEEKEMKEQEKITSLGLMPLKTDSKATHDQKVEPESLANAYSLGSVEATGESFLASGPSTPKHVRTADKKPKRQKKVTSSTSAAARTNAPNSKRTSTLRRNFGVLATQPSSPHMRTTRAQLLRQKPMQARKSIAATKAPSKLKNVTSIEERAVEEKAEGASKAAVATTESKAPSNDSSGTDSDVKKGISARKKFTLTVPSSLSPVKASSHRLSMSSPAMSKSFSSLPKRLESRPFSFSLYPPPVTDKAAAARGQRTLSNLTSALDKLSMPPPSKPASNSRPAPGSEQKDRVRPATSLGFNRDLSLPPMDKLRTEERPRSLSRSGSTSSNKSSISSASRTSHPPSDSEIPRMSGNLKFGFGFGSAPKGTGIFGRHIPRVRASQKSSLPTVEGSPVKGGPSQAMSEEGEKELQELSFDNLDVANLMKPPGSRLESDSEVGNTSVSSSEGTPSASGKELKRISRLNASRRASMAFSALAQQLATPSPTSNTPPTDCGPSNQKANEHTGTEPSSSAEKDALTSSTGSSRPVRAAALRSQTNGYFRAESEDIVGLSEKHSTVTPRERVSESDSELGKGQSSKRGLTGRSKMPGSLDVLAHCTIFVDVRTEDGEDAGALFVDMLRGLGAKVLGRVGQTCTHIVYKNGLSSTVTKYRLLDEPRPHVVGIGWVVDCVEKRACAETDRFRVDLEGVNVAGTLKRRRSILHKPASTSTTSGPMDAFLGGSTSHKPSENTGPSKTVLGSDSDDGQDMPPPSSGSSFNPLEMARRRRSLMVSQ